MSYLEKTLLHMLAAGVQGLVLTALFSVPYAWTNKVPRYTATEMAAKSERYRGINGRVAVHFVWMLVALAVCGLVALALSDAGSRGDGLIELVALVAGIMLIGFFGASFALFTGTYPAFSLRRFGLEYIYDAGSRVKIAALCQIGVTLLVPMTVLFQWYIAEIA